MDLVAILLLPLVAASVSLLPFGNGGRTAATTTVVAAFAVFALAVRVGFRVLERGVFTVLPGWLSVDGLGALLLVPVAFVGCTAAIFSMGYLHVGRSDANAGRVRRYYARYNLFLLSMLAVPILAEVALMWMAVELTTLLSVFLVSFEKTPEAYEAAWKYAMLTCIGAAFALFGILLFYWGGQVAGGGPFSWAELAAAAPRMEPGLVRVAFVFILIGFGAKAGLVPMHTWLPDAHSQAPAPVCALLSGVETSTALYAILRFLPVAKQGDGNGPQTWLLVFGLISVGTAAFLILQVRDYKRLFAFSTVEHMGIMLTAAGIGGSAGHLGATMQLWSHAFTKSFCFLAAGAVLATCGTREMASVRGLIRRAPAAGISLFIGGLAIAGAPPFAVFLSEFAILKAGFAARRWIAASLLAVFVGVAFCGIMAHVTRMVFGTPPKELETQPVPVSCWTALALAAIPVVLFGVAIPESVAHLLRLAAKALGS